MADVRLIDGVAAEKALRQYASCCIGGGPFHTVERAAYKAAADRIRDMPTVETIVWHDDLPPEHDSMFCHLKGTDKWKPGMFEKSSNTVLVTIEYRGKCGEQPRVVVPAHTIDGVWRGLPEALPYVEVVAWAEIPAPMKG